MDTITTKKATSRKGASKPAAACVAGLAAIVSLGSLLYTPHSNAADVQRIASISRSAFAFFQSSTIDINGCEIFNLGTVSAIEGSQTFDPGQPFKQAVLSVDFAQINGCSGAATKRGSAIAFLPAVAFQSAGQKARLDTTVQVLDFLSGNFLDMRLNLAWSCNEAPSRSMFNLHTSQPGQMSMTHQKGMFCNADATGVFTDGQTNYAPQPALFSNIGNGISGNIVIFHN